MTGNNADGNAEDLNIANMVRRKLLLALNKYKNDERAAAALGISERSVWKYKREFGVHRSPKTKEYSLNNKGSLV